MLEGDALDRLRDFGVTNENIAEVQTPANGEGTLFVLDDGSWVLDTAPSDTYTVLSRSTSAAAVTLSDDAIASRLNFSYTVCTGYFTDIKKVSNYLQSGGQSDCRASTTSVYEHEIYMDLYDHECSDVNGSWMRTAQGLFRVTECCVDSAAGEADGLRALVDRLARRRHRGPISPLSRRSFPRSLLARGKIGVNPIDGIEQYECEP